MNFFKKVKKSWNEYLERLGESNSKEFGDQPMSCCSVNKKTMSCCSVNKKMNNNSGKTGAAGRAQSASGK